MSLLFGALITIASTLLAWALLHFNQRRVSRDRTRRAIIHEVDHIADNVAQLIDLESGAISEADVDWVTVTLSTDLLNEDLLQINKLTSPEVRSIYDFYEATRVLESRLEKRTDDRDSDGAPLTQAAREVLATREEVHNTVRRSRLSLFTEWYKERDRQRRNRR